MYLLVLPAFFLLFLTPSGYFSAQVSITSNSRLPMKSFVHDTQSTVGVSTSTAAKCLLSVHAWESDGQSYVMHY